MHTAEGTASPGAFVAACNDHAAFKAAQLDNVEATHVHPHEVAPGPTNAGRALAMLLLRSKQLLPRELALLPLLEAVEKAYAVTAATYRAMALSTGNSWARSLPG